jgi:hypothetical protein
MNIKSLTAVTNLALLARTMREGWDFGGHAFEYRGVEA